MPSLRNMFSRSKKPATGRRQANRVSRKSGSKNGVMSKWLTKKTQRLFEKAERETTLERSQDVVYNDPHAASIIDSMSINIAGTGLIPQSNPYKKILGWTDDQIKTFQEQAELNFSIWCKEADIREGLSFWQMQYSTIYSILMKGEAFRQPCFVDRPGKTFSFCLQSIDPTRVKTPSGMLHDKNVSDGIEKGKYGEAKIYYVADSDELINQYSLDESKFIKIPANVAHRPGMFHVFLKKEDDQTRGVPILSPAIKIIKDLSDYLEYELVGAILAASITLWIETQDPDSAADYNADEDVNGIENRFEEIAAGRVFYGNQNEKPHILKSDRPTNTFDNFVERNLRAIGAAAGMPYEVIAKDFSKTNYSSARAALLEAWRVYLFYQKLIVDDFCQPCWNMVMEESWLRGMLDIPNGQSFYDIKHLITRASWIPPKKGSVDPVKDIKAAVMAIDNNLSTVAQVAAEQGGNWESIYEQRAREIEAEKQLNKEDENA